MYMNTINCKIDYNTINLKEEKKGKRKKDLRKLRGKLVEENDKEWKDERL